MGKEGQLKSNNTTVVYVGARKLKKVEIESILPTYQDIFQRLNSLRKGVDIEHLNAGNAQVNNTFASKRANYPRVNSRIDRLL